MEPPTELIFVRMGSVCLGAVNLLPSILHNNLRVMTLFPLPREVRYSIYQHVLCVPDYLCPSWERHRFPSSWQGPYPSVALLATCRAIREEALEILYSRNRWLLAPRARPNAELPSPWIMLMEKFGAYFRHIVLVYSHRDGRGTQEEMTLINELPREWTEDECLRSLHESATERMINHWETVSNCLTHVTHVESISVDVQDLYCPMGCCRDHIVELLFTNYLLESPQGHLLHKSANLDILGLKSDRERSMFDAWRALRQEQLAIL